MLVATCKEPDPINCTSVEWVEFVTLHQEQYWSVSQLQPADLATAFGSGFVTLGTILIIAKSVGVVLSLIK